MSTHNSSVTDAIRFLANSTNSVRVFEALTEGPTTSRDLAERTGASRSTVLRILDRGDARGWVYSEGSRYGITDVGRAMVEEFVTYRERVEGVQHLGEAFNALPDPAHSLDYRHLRGAEVTFRTETNPFARFDRGLNHIREANTCRWVSSAAPLEYVNVVVDCVEQRGLTVEGVIGNDLVETLRDDPERAEPWHAVADRVYVYDGHLPVSIEIVDETVLLWLTPKRDDRWDGAALLENDHPAVRAWAESLYEEYRREAEPLDPATLPGG
jgi:predicted transcriptional regulator